MAGSQAGRPNTVATSSSNDASSSVGSSGFVDPFIDGEGPLVVGPEVRSTRGDHLLWPEGQPSPLVDAVRRWYDELSAA